jgi:hypothetical protein
MSEPRGKETLPTVREWTPPMSTARFPLMKTHTSSSPLKVNVSLPEY